MPALDKIIMTRLRQWRTDREHLEGPRLLAHEANHARECGLPVLAKLYDLAASLDNLDGRDQLIYRGMLHELQSDVRELISVAIGEANIRLERLEIDEQVPGVPMVPGKVL